MTTHRLSVVGLGPGDPKWRSPEASQRIAEATDLVGYSTYLSMVEAKDGQVVHPSDNREELERARFALDLAARGNNVVIVSSGDPGIFAMAAAVLEVVELGAEEGEWAGVTIDIVPGVTAASAAASRIGAPLGHDFCSISLSDNLKPWSIIESRLRNAALGDFVIAAYNPVSRSRPWQLATAASILGEYRAPETPVVLGRRVGRTGESVEVIELQDLSSAEVDMSTVVIIGSSTTRRFVSAGGQFWVYTPRSYEV